jgi:hypothetical protein
MTRLLAELEIDAAVEDFLRARGVANPQPIVAVLDSTPPEDEAPPDPDWDELTARAAKMYAAPGAETVQEIAERLLARMEE